MTAACDRWTDRQTDRQTELLYQYRAVVLAPQLFHATCTAGSVVTSDQNERNMQDYDCVLRN